jgi:hypothetical protein
MPTTFELGGGGGAAAPENQMGRKSQIWKAMASGFRDPNTKSPQNAQRNYERYLSLARAEAQSGDRIAAENYFQHAEHYFRSMRNEYPTAPRQGS